MPVPTGPHLQAKVTASDRGLVPPPVSCSSIGSISLKRLWDSTEPPCRHQSRRLSRAAPRAQGLGQLFLEHEFNGFENPTTHLRLRSGASTALLRRPWQLRHGVALRSPLWRFRLSTRKVTPLLLPRDSGPIHQTELSSQLDHCYIPAEPSIANNL